jgi:ribosomal protein L16/L10AE
MGKGTGKLSGWVIELYANTILFEYRNLRSGRAVHFCKQVSYRLPSYTRLVWNSGTGKLRNISNSLSINLNSY